MGCQAQVSMGLGFPLPGYSCPDAQGQQACAVLGSSWGTQGSKHCVVSLDFPVLPVTPGNVGLTGLTQPSAPSPGQGTGTGTSLASSTAL